ncbi:DnaJ-like protein xdj1 [Dimargaris cristalligena]|nr:DnaJ-like protein xdj1 [Dimargaris cristalligena]
MSQTYYEVLEVDEQIDEHGLKRAYRKMAMKFHPDKNPEGADRFKEIQHAYEILSDPDSRRMYDQFGEAGLDGAGGPGGHSGGHPFPDDIFADIFGGTEFFGGPNMGGGPPPPSSRPQRSGPAQEKPHDVDVSLADLYTGKKFRMALEKKVVCGVCDGSGSRTGKTFKCKPCGGQGFTLATRTLAPGLTQRIQVVCSGCHGEGRIIRKKDQCRKCHGEKVVRARKVVTITVEPGMADGDRITLAGQGDQTPGQDAPDVIFVLRQTEDAKFQRKDNDLHTAVSISLGEALVGFNRQLVTHLDGRGLVVNQPTGKVVRPGQVKCIYNEGMPHRGKPYLRGALYLTIDIIFPPDHWIKEAREVAALSDLLPSLSAQDTPAPAESTTTVALAQVADDDNPFAQPEPAHGHQHYDGPHDYDEFHQYGGGAPPEMECNQQ